MKKINKELLVERLINIAVYRNMTGSPDQLIYERALREGRTLPEQVLPGYVIESYFSDEEREVIKTLTAEDFQTARPDAIITAAKPVYTVSEHIQRALVARDKQKQQQLKNKNK